VNEPKVYNKYDRDAPPDAIYIGRPSKFGNPFHVSIGQNRERVVQLYREHVMANPELIAMIKRELKGKSVVCFCAPRACHGDVLLEIANS